MNKRGISAIVATVLIILIVVTAAAIIWIAIIPMIQENFAIIDPDTRVDVSFTDGYTNYDAAQNLFSVQVKRGADDSDMTGVRVTVLFDDGTYDKELAAPAANQKTVYVFNLSETGHSNPISVSVSSIVKIGSRSRESVASNRVEIPSATIVNVPATLYVLDGSETDPTCIPTETPESTCDDGLDNDCDYDVDCDDINCAADSLCTCPNGVCASGEICAADNGECLTPPVCRYGAGACSGQVGVDGCFYVAISPGQQDSGRCDDSFMATGCTTLPCQCDGFGNCEERASTDYTPRSCNVDGSATAGVCSSSFKNKTEDTTDGTIDSCLDGTTGIDMWTYNIFINATTVLTTDTIEVICDLKCWSTGGEYGIYYKNSSAGSAWQHVQDGGCVNYNTKTADIPIDDVTGTHYIRCWQKYSGSIAACTGDTSYADHDDMSIEVV